MADSNEINVEITIQSQHSKEKQVLVKTQTGGATNTNIDVVVKKSKISQEHLIQLLSSITLIIASALIIICSLKNDFNIYQASSFICSLFGIIFWALLIYVIFIRTNKLYAIKTIRKRTSNNSSLYMVGETKQYEEKPMNSISAVIGIRGSNIEKLASSVLYTMCGFSCMSFITGLFQHYQYYQVNKENFSIYRELDIICGIIASSSIWLLATWQLEHNGGISDIMHYCSALIYVTFSFLTYIFQSDYSIFSIILPIISIISLCLFAIFGMFGYLENTNINVYWKSFILISCEATVLVSVNIANVLTVFHIENV